jgi:hypothetical protein
MTLYCCVEILSRFWFGFGQSRAAEVLHVRLRFIQKLEGTFGLYTVERRLCFGFGSNRHAVSSLQLALVESSVEATRVKAKERVFGIVNIQVDILLSSTSSLFYINLKEKLDPNSFCPNCCRVFVVFCFLFALEVMSDR